MISNLLRNGALAILALLSANAYAQQDKVESKDEIHLSTRVDIDVSECKGAYTRSDLWSDKFGTVQYELNLTQKTVSISVTGNTVVYGISVSDDKVTFIGDDGKKYERGFLKYEQGKPVLGYKVNDYDCYYFVIYFGQE